MMEEEAQQEKEQVEETTSWWNALYQECRLLYEQDLYRSCELLTFFLLDSNHAGVYRALELLGDCFYRQFQHRRAIAYYRRASAAKQRKDAHPKDDQQQEAEEEAEEEMRATARAREGAEAASGRLAWKESRSLTRLGSIVGAASLLEEASSSSTKRSLTVCLSLAQLALSSGRQEDAREALMDALDRNPYALEALELLQLAPPSSAATAANVTTMMETRLLPRMTAREGSTPLLLPMDRILPLFLGIKESDSFLEETYPHHLGLLQKRALFQSRAGNTWAAQQTLEKIHQLDEYCVEGMDLYASLLQLTNRVDALNRLSMQLLEHHDQSPEAWTVLAMYYQSKSHQGSATANTTSSDCEKAIAFVDKAISIHPRYALAHLVKGHILRQTGRPEYAVVSYFRANEVCPSLESLEGMVESYLAADKYREAVSAAKEAIRFAPRDARAMTLVGLALAKAAAVDTTGNDSSNNNNANKGSEGRKRAKRALRKAVTWASSSSSSACKSQLLKPLLALVELQMDDGDYEVCIPLLQEGVDVCGTTTTGGVNDLTLRLQSKLGDVYTLMERFGDALHCYHTALSLQPDFAEARRGIDRVEKLSKGFDPADVPLPEDDDDEDEEEEDEEEEEEEDDEEEEQDDRNDDMET